MRGVLGRLLSSVAAGGASSQAANAIGQVEGDAATFAELSAITGVVDGDYVALTADDIGNGTADMPQYPQGLYRIVGGVPEFRLGSGVDGFNEDYDYISVNGDFNLTTYDGNAQMITTSSSIGEAVITYGAFNAPQTLTLQDGEHATFVFNGVTGWTPLVVPVSADTGDIHGWFDWYFQPSDFGDILPHYSAKNGLGVELRDAGNDNYLLRGRDFEINEPTFAIDFIVRKETVSDRLYIDLRDANNLLNRLFFNPVAGTFTFAGSNGGTANVENLDDRWRVFVEFNAPLQGTHRVDIVADHSIGGVTQGSNVFYSFDLFAKPEVANDTTTLSGSPSGFYRIEQASTIVNLGTADTPFNTGFDLTQSGELMLRFMFSDAGGSAREWASGFLNVDRIIERFNAGDATDGFAHVFDNDFIVINLVNPSTGEMLLRENGRDVGVRAELWAVAPVVPLITEVQNVNSLTVTGAFQNLGDANTLFTGEDGSRIHVEYGDETRDSFVFFNGIARADRNLTNANNSVTHEFTIDAGQIQVRHLDNASTIAFAWYETAMVNVGTPTKGTPLALAYATTTSDRDDPNTGDDIVFDEVEIVSGGVTIVGSTVTLPQSDTLYELTWHGGFDFDGNPDDGIEFGFVGSIPPLLNTNAEADVFDTTINGITFSAFQFMRPSAFAEFDASAGDITVELQVLNGATDIDITEGYLKVSQAPTSSAVIQDATEEAPIYFNDIGYNENWRDFTPDQAAADAFDGLKFWRKGNTVYLSGLVARVNSPSLDIATLPESYRPARRIVTSASVSSLGAGAATRVDIHADGRIEVITAALQINGWISINAAFTTD